MSEEERAAEEAQAEGEQQELAVTGASSAADTVAVSGGGWRSWSLRAQAGTAAAARLAVARTGSSAAWEAAMHAAVRVAAAHAEAGRPGLASSGKAERQHQLADYLAERAAGACNHPAAVALVLR